MLPGGGLDDALRNISGKLLHHLDTMACYRGEWRRSGCGWHRNPNSPPATPPNFTPTRRTLSLSCGMPVNAKIESKMKPEFNDSKIHAILCTARHLRYPANVQFWHITFLSHVLTCA